MSRSILYSRKLLRDPIFTERQYAKILQSNCRVWAIRVARICLEGFYFADLISVVCQSTAITAKIESLENFRLYGMFCRFDVAPSSTQIWLDNLNCPYDAVRLTQCTHNGIGVENCYHSEDVYVSCLGSE